MRRTLFTLAVALAAATALPAFAGEGPQMPAPFVTVGKVSQADNIEIKRYTGQVVHAASVNLVARVSGEILYMNFKEGQSVDQGQALYELDPIRYRAEVQNVEAKVEENRARLNYAAVSQDRNRNLYEQRAASKDNLDSADSEYDAIRAALAAAEAQLITVKDDLANTIISAPITGKIGVSNYTEGNYLTPNSGTIATIIQMDPLRVHFAISNRDFLAMFGTEGQLKENAIIRLRLANDSMYEQEGRVEFIDNQANTRTDSVQVYASFANPDWKLIPGSTATVLLSRRTGGTLPAVLPSAVMHDAKNAYIYVLDSDNKIERRDVVLGQLSGNRQLVREGVLPGENIVVDGTHKAMPGMTVVPDYIGSDDAVAAAPVKMYDSVD